MNDHALGLPAMPGRLVGWQLLGILSAFFAQGTVGAADAPPLSKPVKAERPIPDDATKRDLLKSLDMVVQDVKAEKDPNSRANAFINAAYAQAKLGEIEKARRTFGSAAQSAREIEDKKYRLIRLKVIIGEQAGIRDLKGIEETSDILLEESEKPDASAKELCLSSKIQVQNEIAKDLARSGKIAQARERFQASLELLEGYGENVEAWKRSLGNTLVALVTVGELDFAFKTLAAIPQSSREIRGSLLSIVVGSSWPESSQTDQEVLERLLKFSDGLPGDRVRPLIFQKLTVARARSGDLSGALRCVEWFTDDLTKANMLGHVVGERAKAGDFRGAYEMVHMIGKGASDPRTIKFKASAFETIAKEERRRGDLAAARRAWDEAIRIAEKFDTDLQRAEQLAVITSARADLGDIAGALKVVESIRGDDHQKGQAMVAIARAQLRADQRADAISTLKRASEILEQVSIEIKQMKERNGRERNDALRPLAIAFAEAGLLDEAVNHAMAFDEIYFQAPIIANIAVVQVQKGDVEGALKTVGRISDSSHKAYAMGEVARTQAASGHAAEARLWIDKLESPMHRAIVYRSMVNAFAWPGRP